MEVNINYIFAILEGKQIASMLTHPSAWTLSVEAVCLPDCLRATQNTSHQIVQIAIV